MTDTGSLSEPCLSKSVIFNIKTTVKNVEIYFSFNKHGGKKAEVTLQFG
jgi:hypothetical protein